jgi:hypothetical protein
VLAKLFARPYEELERMPPVAPLKGSMA